MCPRSAQLVQCTRQGPPPSFILCVTFRSICILIDRVVIIQLKGIPMVQDATQNVGQLGHVTTIGSGENTDSLRQPNHLQSKKIQNFLVILVIID